jgi:hypothetical protein
VRGHIKNKSPKIFSCCRRTTYARGRCHPQPLSCMDFSGLNTFSILGYKQSWVQSAPKYNIFDTEFIVRHCRISVVEKEIKVRRVVVVKIKFVTKQVTLLLKKNCWHCCRLQGSTGEGLCTGFMLYFLRIVCIWWIFAPVGCLMLVLIVKCGCR